MIIEEALVVVLEAGYDCGGNHYWSIQRINDESISFPLSDVQEDYGMLLNRFGRQGWELIRVIPYLNDDNDEMGRTAHFHRRQHKDGLQWEYTVVLIYIGNSETAPDHTNRVDVMDANLLASARTHVSEGGWEIVEAIEYAWAWRTLEVIFKRRPEIEPTYTVSRAWCDAK